MEKKLIYADDLLAEIERLEGIMHHCDSLKVDNIKDMIKDAPAVDPWYEIGRRVGEFVNKVVEASQNYDSEPIQWEGHADV